MCTFILMCMSAHSTTIESFEKFKERCTKSPQGSADSFLLMRQSSLHQALNTAPDLKNKTKQPTNKKLLNFDAQDKAYTN